MYIYIPQLPPTGMQQPGAGYVEVRDTLVDFDEYYDRSAVEIGLAKLGIQLASKFDEEVHLGLYRILSLTILYCIFLAIQRGRGETLYCAIVCAMKG